MRRPDKEGPVFIAWPEAPPARAAASGSAVKVRLSREAVLNLHTLKVLAGRTISDTVEARDIASPTLLVLSGFLSSP